MTDLLACAGRFWSKVAKADGDACWTWTASCDGKGYGRITIGSRRAGTRRLAIASRVSWELAYGAIPSGLFVLHRCDVRACVRPEHLFLGTHADNMADMREKGRIPRGESHYGAQLTDAGVRRIREAVRSGRTRRSIAAELGVSAIAAGFVARGETWRHVKDVA